MTTSPGQQVVQTLAFAAPDDGEELARAELYGLLARLYFAPPDEELLAQFKVAVTQAPAQGGFLEAPWESLVAAMRATDTQAVADEYEALFMGLGKPEVFLYGSHHLAGFLNERPLAALRADLAQLGLTRDEARGETEDHISYLFEVMRYLIAGDDVSVSNLARQRDFFAAHVQPWIGALCDAINAHPKARFYARLADFTRAFTSVEAQGFDMLP